MDFASITAHIEFMVYKLSTETRAQVLRTLCEGNGMRATGRICDVAQNSVLSLLEEGGQACLWMHDDLVRNVKSTRIQCDEIWSFTYCKGRNAAKAKAAPECAGDTWLWTALDADSKMILSYYVADRKAKSARIFLQDMESRLANRVQLSTDGLASYPTAVFRVFEGKGIDYAIVDKIYANTAPVNAATRYSPAQCVGAKRRAVIGNPDPAHVSTSYVERSNLTLRMTNRRYTRLTNGFSRKIQNHIYAVALGFAAYNFCKQHKGAGKLSPAMAAGVTDKLWSFEDIVERIDYYAPPPKPRGPYKKRLAEEE